MYDEDKKKEYSIIGKVEIGTDEYRDLIESVKDAKKEASENRRDYWKEQEKAREATKNVDKLNKKLSNYIKFINSDVKLVERFNLYIATQTTEDEDE